MADDRSKRGKADGDRVAAGEPYEVAYAAKTMGASAGAVRAATKAAGPLRKNVKKAVKRT